MKQYLIPKGEHRSTWFPRFHFKGHEFTIKVKFNSSCRYKIHGDDQYDINKIGGYGFGWNHHKNSFRLGWTWNTDKKKIVLWAYVYYDGNRTYQAIKECSDTETVTVRVKLGKTSGWPVWMVYANRDIAPTYIQASGSFPKWGFKLYPYFGGQETAPHDIEIGVEV